MPHLILFRHGNTFEARQTPVWVGARSDFPLTAAGEEQAEAAARYIEREYPVVSEIVAGPLQRTRRFAEIVAQYAGREVFLDERLCEIDYGLWEGLSGEAIAQRFGKQAVEQWEQNGMWPEDMNWSPTREVLQQRLSAFLQEQHDKLVSADGAQVAVTSNGILRVIYALATGEEAGSKAKVKTGHVCVLVPEGPGWRVAVWNAKP